jgi:hypothetical protein
MEEIFRSTSRVIDAIIGSVKKDCRNLSATAARTAGK